jgi:hypothetical protein
MRFNDIDDLSVLFAEIDDKLMSSSDKVDDYIKNNPDTNKNNARRNKLLKEHFYQLLNSV